MWWCVWQYHRFFGVAVFYWCISHINKTPGRPTNLDIIICTGISRLFGRLCSVLSVNGRNWNQWLSEALWRLHTWCCVQNLKTNKLGKWSQMTRRLQSLSFDKQSVCFALSSPISLLLLPLFQCISLLVASPHGPLPSINQHQSSSNWLLNSFLYNSQFHSIVPPP